MRRLKINCPSGTIRSRLRKINLNFLSKEFDAYCPAALPALEKSCKHPAAALPMRNPANASRSTLSMRNPIYTSCCPFPHPVDINPGHLFLAIPLGHAQEFPSVTFIK